MKHISWNNEHDAPGHRAKTKENGPLLYWMESEMCSGPILSRETKIEGVVTFRAVAVKYEKTVFC
jgi:hypothetical protein